MLFRFGSGKTLAAQTCPAGVTACYYNSAQECFEYYMDSDICHINLAPGFRGGERQTFLLIRELAQFDWQQQAVVRKGGKLAEHLKRESIPKLRVIEKPASIIAASIGIGKPRLIHVHQGRSLKVAYIHYLLKNTPYLITRRVDNLIRPTRLNKIMYKHANYVAVLTSPIRAKVEKINPDAECRIIPSAAALLAHSSKRIQEIREWVGRDFLIGHVGALDESHKGQSQIVEAARILEHTHPDVAFVLVGSGADEAKLKAMCQGLNNVFFAGEVADVGNYLGAFDLFVFPSRNEGLGSSILDAYQFGLPVIATNAGGIPDVVTDGENGALFQVDDVSAFVDELKTYHDDKDLRERVSATNLREAKLYTPAIMAAKYNELYMSVLGASGKT